MSEDRFRCPVCRLEAEIVHVTDRGLVCQTCAMRRQEADDEARWKRAERAGESPAEKCAREAREFTQREETRREGRRRG